MKNDSFTYFVQKYFVSYMTAQRGYGENTVTSYRDTFRLLLIFLSLTKQQLSKFGIADLSREKILAFLSWLETERNNAPATKNVRLAHLKSFYGYVMSVSPDFSDVCSHIMGIPFAKVAKAPPTHLSELETRHLLDAPDPRRREGLRHLAVLSLLYDSGCRVQELIELSVSDVTLGKCCRLYVHGKGDKYREIPILGETGKILRKYINVFALTGHEPLFKNRQGNRLTRQGISHILKKYRDIVETRHPDEVHPKISPHRIRHSKATHLINAGVNIFNIRDFLGHSSVATTQIYLTSNPEVMREAIENAASKSVPENPVYCTEEKKSELLAFLEQLV